MRRGQNNTIRLTLKRKPHGKKLRVRPRMRWIDIVVEDLRYIGIVVWDKWGLTGIGGNVVLTTKTHRVIKARRKR